MSGHSNKDKCYTKQLSFSVHAFFLYFEKKSTDEPNHYYKGNNNITRASSEQPVIAIYPHVWNVIIFIYVDI